MSFKTRKVWLKGFRGILIFVKKKWLWSDSSYFPLKFDLKFGNIFEWLEYRYINSTKSTFTQQQQKNHRSARAQNTKSFGKLFIHWYPRLTVANCFDHLELSTGTTLPLSLHFSQNRNLMTTFFQRFFFLCFAFVCTSLNQFIQSFLVHDEFKQS